MNARPFSLVALFSTISLVAAFAVPAVPADLVPSMAALDKKYIPALGLSGQPDHQATAKIAFVDFEKAWADFDRRFSSQAGFDAEWKEELAQVDEAVARAKTALIDDSNGPAAHEALEAVRMTFLASRSRQKIPYFLDTLTLFHNSMEDLLNGKPGKKVADWSEAEKMGFSADLDIAIARWKKVKAMEGLLPAAALPAKASLAYANQWHSIDSIMAAAKKAFEAGDERAFSEKLGQLKPNFIRTFFLFGDFPQ
jgi:hypothetical protein